MADLFWNCPNTGGEKPCNPACLCFVRGHTDRNGRIRSNYCRIYGSVDQAETVKRLEFEESERNGS